MGSEACISLKTSNFGRVQESVITPEAANDDDKVQARSAAAKDR